jgi:hypothetical protein
MLKSAISPGAPMAWAAPDRSTRTSCNRSAPPAADPTPAGPIVQESHGRTSAARTYEDLLGDAHDEALFDYYFTGQLVRVDLSGAAQAIDRQIIGERPVDQRLHRLPLDRGNRDFRWEEARRQPVKTLVDRPLADDLPVDFDATVKGPRDAVWRSDAPPLTVASKSTGRSSASGRSTSVFTGCPSIVATAISVGMGRGTRWR